MLDLRYITCHLTSLCIPRHINLLCALILLGACSLGSKQNNPPPPIEFNDYSVYQKKDFINHFETFNKFFLQGPDVQLVKTSNYIEDYLKDVAKKILSNNELFFTNLKDTTYFIVNDQRPYHFSLPPQNIYLSLGLIRKYISHESELASVISFEMVKLEKNVFEKNIIVPTHYLGIERLTSLVRVDMESKIEIHKWAYYLLKRSGFDSDIYLSWIQLMNRNTVDFQLHSGDIGSISREEALFKRFLVSQNEAVDYKETGSFSSVKFYKVLNYFNRVGYEG